MAPIRRSMLANIQKKCLRPVANIVLGSNRSDAMDWVELYIHFVILKWDKILLKNDNETMQVRAEAAAELLA